MKDEYDFSKSKKGRAFKSLKIVKTFRLDPEVLEWLEAEGKKQSMGYQTYLNWFLRKAMSSTASLEDRVEKLEKAIRKKA